MSRVARPAGAIHTETSPTFPDAVVEVIADLAVASSAVFTDVGLALVSVGRSLQSLAAPRPPRN